jgi:hypothetical protein
MVGNEKICIIRNFFIRFLYGDVPDESEFLRTARPIWLEIKSDNVEDMSRRILESALVRKLEMGSIEKPPNAVVPQSWLRHFSCDSRFPADSSFIDWPFTCLLSL